ncbi:MAG: DNA polymerase IV [Propionibacteriales bacterium]|nr:DNA polymerase IV [Propionibacteriales bacterium]
MATRRWVLHVDLDQFVAAVEVLRRPELRGRPVVVGGDGDPTKRGVVSTASYEAREFGVRSGTPMRTAARRCPDAVFLPVDAPAYEAASAQVMATLRSFPGVVVEVLGWDEAFMELTEQGDDPERFARVVQAAVLDRTRLHCSVGIGDNKLRAKIATEFGKPAGTFSLTAANWHQVMDDRPTDALWGIGRKTAKRLAALGFTTVGELAAADAARLAGELGPVMGPWYRRLARGVDNSPVVGSPYVARSRSRETTFQQDLTDWSRVQEEVRRLVHRVMDDVSAEGRPVVQVGLKVRFVPFQTYTRSVTLAAPTLDPAEVEAGAVTALGRFEDHRAVRLLGVRAELEDPRPAEGEQRPPAGSGRPRSVLSGGDDAGGEQSEGQAAEEDPV